MNAATEADTWLCPDCTTDLKNPVRHPGAWRFCPFTGRPKGVRHVTPQEMQRRWNALQEALRDAHPSVAFMVLGVLKGWSQEIDQKSYLGRSSGTDVVPSFPNDAAEHAWELGRDDLVDMLRHTIEWKDHLVDLMTGQRALKSFDGKDMDPDLVVTDSDMACGGSGRRFLNRMKRLMEK